jgi:hypothetical protein
MRSLRICGKSNLVVHRQEFSWIEQALIKSLPAKVLFIELRCPNRRKVYTQQVSHFVPGIQFSMCP